MFYIDLCKNENDSHRASKIYALSWKKAYRGIFNDEYLDNLSLDFWVSSFNSNYQTNGFKVFIIGTNNQDFGACAFGQSRDFKDIATAEILSYYFLPEFWGRGYAKLFIDIILYKIIYEGYHYVHLWALKNNPRARRFYEKCGFSLSGREREFTYNNKLLIEVEYEMKLL